MEPKVVVIVFLWGTFAIQSSSLRGLAAFGVAFYHTDFRLAGAWHTDFS
jgi:peptidoglycan/LPS O-acetylase OafA/YrhL